jgi:hypothetical protein
LSCFRGACERTYDIDSAVGDEQLI